MYRTSVLQTWILKQEKDMRDILGFLDRDCETQMPYEPRDYALQLHDIPHLEDPLNVFPSMLDLVLPKKGKHELSNGKCKLTTIKSNISINYFIL